MTNIDDVKVYYCWYPPIWYFPSNCMTAYIPIKMEAKIVKRTGDFVWIE